MTKEAFDVLNGIFRAEPKRIKIKDMLAHPFVHLPAKADSAEEKQETAEQVAKDMQAQPKPVQAQAQAQSQAEAQLQESEAATAVPNQESYSASRTATIARKSRSMPISSPSVADLLYSVVIVSLLYLYRLPIAIRLIPDTQCTFPRRFCLWPTQPATSKPPSARIAVIVVHWLRLYFATRGRPSPQI